MMPWLSQGQGAAPENIIEASAQRFSLELAVLNSLLYL
jgi:hypothetical protein